MGNRKSAKIGIDIFLLFAILKQASGTTRDNFMTMIVEWPVSLFKAELLTFAQ